MGGDVDIAMFYLQAVSFRTESCIFGQFELDVAVFFNRDFETCCRYDLIVEVTCYPH